MRTAICAVALLVSNPSWADADAIRVSHGYGLLYLPLIVMRDQRLLEKHAALAGIRKLDVSWVVLDGGNLINDAMLVSRVDVAGVPGFLTLWSKTRGIPGSEVIGLSGLSTSALWLNTNRAAIRTLADFGPADRIAVPGFKTSLSAVILQMAVGVTFGLEEYDRLDAMTVNLRHIDAMTALLSGNGAITAHLASPPFSYRELADPRVHRVFDSSQLLGDLSADVVFASKRFVDANPRLVECFLAAQEEANQFIASQPAQAARIFAAQDAGGASRDEVRNMLRDPGTRFSSTPRGIMQYVLFMSKAGTVRHRPARWSDPFIDAMKDRPGS